MVLISGQTSVFEILFDSWPDFLPGWLLPGLGNPRFPGTGCERLAPWWGLSWGWALVDSVS